MSHEPGTVTVDHKADMACVYLRRVGPGEIARTEVVRPHLLVNYNVAGEVADVEILTLRMFQAEPVHEVECPSCHTTIRARMADAEINLSQCGLTARQVEVLGLLTRQGLSNKDIASRLSLSYRTVEKHLEAILRKTATRSRHELLARLRVDDAPGSEWERAYRRQGVEVVSLQEEVDRLEARGEADRIDELNRWVARIGDANTISEALSDELRARIAELRGDPSDSSGSAGVVPQ